MILGTQRYFGNKQGVGFDPCNASSNKTVFIRASNQKSVQRKPFYKFSKKEISCHYCGRYRHSINKCFVRNHPHKFKQVWVPKGVGTTNKNGPKMMWVPKGITWVIHFVGCLGIK